MSGKSLLRSEAACVIQRFALKMCHLYRLSYLHAFPLPESSFGEVINLPMIVYFFRMYSTNFSSLCKAYNILILHKPTLIYDLKSLFLM